MTASRRYRMELIQKRGMDWLTTQILESRCVKPQEENKITSQQLSEIILKQRNRHCDC